MSEFGVSLPDQTDQSPGIDPFGYRSQSQGTAYVWWDGSTGTGQTIDISASATKTLTYNIGDWSADAAFPLADGCRVYVGEDSTTYLSLDAIRVYATDGTQLIDDTSPTEGSYNEYTFTDGYEIDRYEADVTETGGVNRSGLELDEEAQPHNSGQHIHYFP